MNKLDPEAVTPLAASVRVRRRSGNDTVVILLLVVIVVLMLFVIAPVLSEEVFGPGGNTTAGK